MLIVVGLVLRFIGADRRPCTTIEHYAFLVGAVRTDARTHGSGDLSSRLLDAVVYPARLRGAAAALFQQRAVAALQFLSSELGVWVIRAAGISVLLEGNIIDLGNYQLEVAEACSGLRYLFPLMTLAFIVAYLFRGPLWKRTVIFLSSIPITVVMNSVRIGFIGITVERWGTGMAEGALHDFEGWLVFMLSTGAVILTALGLRAGGSQEAALARGVFDSGHRLRTRPAAKRATQAPATASRAVPRPFVAAAVLVLAGRGGGCRDAGTRAHLSAQSELRRVSQSCRRLGG